jgi:hypothetical protein
MKKSVILSSSIAAACCIAAVVITILFLYRKIEFENTAILIFFLFFDSCVLYFVKDEGRIVIIAIFSFSIIIFISLIMALFMWIARIFSA